MPGIKNQRRMASEILKCGTNRIWIDPDHLEDVETAITREDIKSLIKKGYISARQKKGISRARARKIAEQKAKGKRRGHGSIKGSAYARLPRKERWMRTIRAIRNELKKQRNAGRIDATTYRHFYIHAKGGAFRSRAHLISHMKAQGLLKEEMEETKEEIKEEPKIKVGAERKPGDENAQAPQAAAEGG